MADRRNRWWRRWIIAAVIWAVPVVMVAVKEIHDDLAYNQVDLQSSLSNWTLTAAQRASGAQARCRGTPDQARANGCPPSIVALNDTAFRAARELYSQRRNVLFTFIGQAIFSYWVVPCLFVLLVGLLVAGVRLALRRPPSKQAAKRPSP
jgi:hypothetical protein